MFCVCKAAGKILMKRVSRQRNSFLMYRKFRSTGRIAKAILLFPHHLLSEFGGTDPHIFFKFLVKIIHIFIADLLGNFVDF